MSEQQLRVMIVCDHIDYDGAIHGGGRQIVELSRALEDSRVEPTVCVLRGASALGRQLQAEGLPFLFLDDHRFSPATLGHLVRLIHERDIQVLHLTDCGAATFGRIAGWLTGVPTIVQVISHHSKHERMGFPRYVELAFRTLAPLTAKALAVSSSVKDFAVERMGFGDDEVEVLHSPLPKYSLTEPTAEQVASLRRAYGIGEADPVVGAVTRFHHTKGIRYLIEAFPAVLLREPRAWLMLVGQGPEQQTLADLARALGIEKRVIFAGFQREPQAYVGMFHVSVVPSLEEALGLVALESLALGVPVVASRVGGLPDVVQDGETGLLVDAERPDAIAAAVLRILGDDALRRRMSAAARVDVQRFSLDAYTARLTEIYCELAERNGDTRRLRRGTRALQESGIGE